MLSQRKKYTYQVIMKYLTTHLNYYPCINEKEEYYGSRDIRSEFWHKRWSKNLIKN